jgi:enoyl-CoA hydratase/carnithine racemase
MADLEISRRQAVQSIRLNRPGKKNSLTDGMYRDIAAALMHADQDEAVAAVVIEAEGPDFCSGNDLAGLRDLAAGAVTLDQLHTNHFLTALRGFGKPLLASVTGRAIGVGATLLLHCDVVHAAHDSSLRFPFVTMGLVPEAGCAYFLPARIGYARAYALLCLGEAISGHEAASIGLVTASFPANEVRAQIHGAAARLAAQSAGALRATKALMRDQTAIAAAMQADQAAMLARLASPEISQHMRNLCLPQSPRERDGRQASGPEF